MRRSLGLLGRASTAFIVTASIAACLAPQRAAAGPEGSVKYFEQQLRSGADPRGRELHTSRGALFAIDINSSVKIDVDERPFEAAVVAQLQNIAPTEKDAALVQQFEALRDAAAKIKPTMEGVKELFDLWAQAEQTQDYARYKMRSKEVNGDLLTLIDSLLSAIEKRLTASGLSLASAHAQADSDLATVLTDNLVFGYNWEAFGELYAREIRAATDALAASARDKGLGVAIRAGLVIGPNQTAPISLPGYNQVATGVSTVVPKVTYAISPEKKQQFETLREAAAKLDEANSFGDATLKLLHVNLEMHEQDIRKLLSGVAASATELKTAIEALGKWRNAATRRDWLARNRDRLQGTPAGQTVVMHWDEVDKALSQIDATLAAVTAFADVRTSLRTTTDPADALSLVQSAFARLPHPGGGDATNPQEILNASFWAEQLETLSQGVGGLTDDARAALAGGDSPLAGIDAVRNKGADFVRAITTVPIAARTAVIGTLAEAPIRFAASLPVPDGERIAALDANASLDTSFDLKTIAGGRNRDQEVRVEFHFFRGDEELETLGWADTFHIGMFGWQDHVAAGIAFVQQESAETWKPTATLSWLLKKKSWPEGSEAGLDFGTPEWYSGFGLSALPLEFDDTKDVEVGIALTGSFLNDRILIGYGSNLNVAENDKFWFISFRIFENEGFNKGVLGE